MCAILSFYLTRNGVADEKKFLPVFPKKYVFLSLAKYYLSYFPFMTII